MMGRSCINWARKIVTLESDKSRNILVWSRSCPVRRSRTDPLPTTTAATAGLIICNYFRTEEH
ncbi:unnamed protein product, partial [Amoebophrya sp. A120]|eukprot:GSA120T00023912001.1